MVHKNFDSAKFIQFLTARLRKKTHIYIRVLYVISECRRRIFFSILASNDLVTGARTRNRRNISKSSRVYNEGKRRLHRNQKQSRYYNLSRSDGVPLVQKVESHIQSIRAPTFTYSVHVVFPNMSVAYPCPRQFSNRLALNPNEAVSKRTRENFPFRSSSYTYIQKKHLPSP